MTPRRAFWAGFEIRPLALLQSLMARREGFEPPTPRFEVRPGTVRGRSPTFASPWPSCAFPCADVRQGSPTFALFLLPVAVRLAVS